MAFVKEELKNEEDKALFNSFKFIDPVYDEPAYPRYWRIDRDRNAFLAGIGGGVEIPSFYAFVWNNNVTLFSAYEDMNTNKLGQLEWVWDVLKFLAPKSFAEHDKELIDMIKEAFIETMILPEEKKRRSKYIFNFKTNPQYILEGDEYKKSFRFL